MTSSETNISGQSSPESLEGISFSEISESTSQRNLKLLTQGSQTMENAEENISDDILDEVGPHDGLEGSVHCDGSLHNSTKRSTNGATKTRTVGVNTKISQKGVYQSEAQKLLKCIKAHPEAEHSDTLANVDNIAISYGGQGRLVETVEQNEKVLETHIRTLGAEHSDKLTSMGNLATSYRSQGNAVELDEKVVETRKRILAADHPDTLASMANLAVLYRSQGKLREAVELDERAQEVRKSTLEVDHPGTM